MSAIVRAQEARDLHVRETMQWHFNPATGCPFWLNWARENDKDPIRDVDSLSALVDYFDPFDDSLLKTVSMSDWHPAGFKGVAWSGFVTGGTTGSPSRRWGRRGPDSDYARDYRRLSAMLPPEGFPDGGSALHIGPGGTRRLALGVELMAELRGAGFNLVDMDVAWMKNPNNTAAKAYKAELVERAMYAIKTDKPEWVFCPPILIEAIGEKIDWTTTSVKGVFAGGTEMSPEMVHNIMVNHFKGKIYFVPAFGNALVGLAPARKIATPENPIEGQRDYSVIYEPFEPHTIIRLTNPEDSRKDVGHGEKGVLEITTISTEFLMPRKLERDEAECYEPTEEYPVIGICEVGPTAAARKAMAGTTSVY